MHARDVVDAGASALVLGSFITLALVALWYDKFRWVGARGVAALGLSSLVLRAIAMIWPHCIIWCGNHFGRGTQ